MPASGDSDDTKLERESSHSKSEIVSTPSSPPARTSSPPDTFAFAGPPSGGGGSISAINVAVGGSPELAALQRLPPEHLATVFDNAHKLELKRLDSQDKQLVRVATFQEKQHEREHDLEVTRRSRVATLILLLLAAMAIITCFLFWKEKEDLAFKVLALFFSHVFALVGGVGYEKWRASSSRNEKAE